MDSDREVEKEKGTKWKLKDHKTFLFSLGLNFRQISSVDQLTLTNISVCFAEDLLQDGRIERNFLLPRDTLLRMA